MSADTLFSPFPISPQQRRCVWSPCTRAGTHTHTAGDAASESAEKKGFVYTVRSCRDKFTFFIFLFIYFLPNVGRPLRIPAFFFLCVLFEQHSNSKILAHIVAHISSRRDCFDPSKTYFSKAPFFLFIDCACLRLNDEQVREERRMALPPSGAACAVVPSRRREPREPRWRRKPLHYVMSE